MEYGPRKQFWSHLASQRFLHGFLHHCLPQIYYNVCTSTGLIYVQLVQAEPYFLREGEAVPLS